MQVKVTSHVNDVIEAKNRCAIIALEVIGLKCEGYAAAKAPVDTGRLRNSITHYVQDSTSVIVGTAVEYAAYQEFGTIRTKPHPFLKPAVYNHLQEYKQIIESYLGA